MDRPVLAAGMLVILLGAASFALRYVDAPAEQVNTLLVLVHGLLLGVGVFLVRRARYPFPVPDRGTRRARRDE